MIDKILTAIFGSKHERDVKAMRPAVAQINALEPEVSALQAFHALHPPVISISYHTFAGLLLFELASGGRVDRGADD